MIPPRCPIVVVTFFALAFFCSPSTVGESLFGDDAGCAWSFRMANTIIKRNTDSIAYPEDPRSGRWGYEQGVLLEALRRLGTASGDTSILAYVKKNIDRYVRADGSIATYEFNTFNLDNIPIGRQLLALFATTHDAKYRAAADTLRKQLSDQPRNREGGFWHKKIYPDQMWLDGLYMAEPFYAEYASMFHEPAAYDDVVHQFVTIERHTRDTATGLLYHAWDESRKQRWADPVSGHSPNFWGRAMGWYAMGLVDVLDVLPAEHPGRPQLIAILRRLSEAVLNFRDPGTGLWYQVADQGERKGNYLESSASCMFVYAFAKGVRKGYLPGRFLSSARESFDAIIRGIVTIDANGDIELRHACQGAGLGGTPYRDGSYEYYIGERQRTNDFKAVGPFIMAALELEAQGRGTISWKACLEQAPRWYASADAARIADNVLLYQCPDGGWPKNIDMAIPVRAPDIEELARERKTLRSTIDNGATYTQIRYLAKVTHAVHTGKYTAAMLQGIDFLLRAQYPNGGWPQFFPAPEGYERHITFNDDATAGVLNLLIDVTENKPEFSIVDPGRRRAASAAVERGIACILGCQIRVNGELTGWCAQHDENSLAPAAARTYELPSVSGRESVGIVEVLLRTPNPSAAVIASVQGAVNWLEKSRLSGMRLVDEKDTLLVQGADRVVVADPQAPPLWARFYDIRTNKPFFCSRDGIPRDHLSEISWERRNRYNWLGNWPLALLQEEYPAWKVRWNVWGETTLGKARAESGNVGTVGLDYHYNSEWRTRPDGRRVQFHYVWEDTTNSGFSLLGETIRSMGAHITALRDAPTRENLRPLSIYIIVDPDTPLETADPHFILPGSADAIVEWVKEGGILVLMGNDSGNAEFAHLNALGERFGIHFNEDSHHRVVGTDFAAGTCDSFPSHPVFKGVRRVYLKEISSLRLRPPATPFLRDGNLVVMATSRAGKGMVFAVGDPWLYNEYFDARKLPPGYDNARAGEHLFRWLLQHAHRHGSPAGSQPKND